MNILYICHYAGSLDMGMAFRPYYLAREWQKLGHKVRIIGASFSHLRVKNPDVVQDFEKQNIDGIEYQWIKTVSYDHNGVKRAYTMWQFCSKLWMHAKKIVDDFHPDVVITSSTYPMDSWPAQRIVKLSGAKLIHENHDIWPLTLTTIGKMSENHPFVKVVTWGLKSALKHSDAVVCVLPYAYEYFEKFVSGVKDRFFYIPNGVAKSDWIEDAELPEEHRALLQHYQGKFVVLYLGSHSDVYGLDELINAAHTMRNENVHVLFVGQGNDKRKLIEYAKRLGCDNVSFLPGVSKTCVPSLLKKVDLLYATIAVSKELGKYGVGSNKVYDYMMSGNPIIFSYNARNKEILDAKCGFEIFIRDADEICGMIRKVMNLTIVEKELLGQNGRNWVLENCEYSVLAQKFLEVIEKVE